MFDEKQGLLAKAEIVLTYADGSMIRIDAQALDVTLSPIHTSPSLYFDLLSVSHERILGFNLAVRTCPEKSGTHYRVTASPAKREEDS